MAATRAVVKVQLLLADGSSRVGKGHSTGLQNINIYTDIFNSAAIFRIILRWNTITGLTNAATKYSDHIALITKGPDGKPINYTYREYEENVRTTAKAFLKLGLQKFHGVCILGFNSPEWFFSCLGAICAGGISTGIYTTNSSKEQTDEELDNVLKTIAINQCCTAVFTSGTTGNPKGVMLSHDNIIYDASCIVAQLKFNRKSEVVISYLPLSHVAAQIVDMYLIMLIGGTIYFADKNALKGSLLNTLLEARPTRFLGVPRVWEKIYEKMIQVGDQNGIIKKFIASWAKSQGLQFHLNRINGALIFTKIKQALGFDRCLTYASAAAPISPDLKSYFMSIDIPISESYGMSELSGAHTMGEPETFDVNSVGKVIPGVKTKIVNSDAEQNGEVCMYGRHVFMGYLNEPVKTSEVVDEQGWMHSGDIGKIDYKSRIYITGRLKELLITAGGENVAPVPIEQQVQLKMKYISNVILIGDKRKFLSMLLTLKTEVNPDTGVPTDTLTKEVQAWLSSLDSQATTVSAVLAEGPHPKVLNAIEEDLKSVNQLAISNAQKIQKFAILPKDFSIQDGELGPTMKLKRHIIVNKYSVIIDGLYGK
ncbi:bubblegum [Carabus blaptoides fortunei]